MMNLRLLLIILPSYEKMLVNQNFHVSIVGDSNAPGFDCKHGLSLPSRHFYFKHSFLGLQGSTPGKELCLQILKKRKPDSLCSVFFFYRKLVKLTIKLTDLRLLMYEYIEAAPHAIF
jgi:hypothetical protein